MSEKPKVLYFEDDVGSQRLVQRVLENHNYEVLIAENGMQGLHLARQATPHLILMDINLPGMNGREITTRLRSLSNLNHVPIVALTANNSPGLRERALAAGCDGFLTKPIDVITFPNRVNTYLEGYRERLDTEEHLVHLERHAHDIVARLESKIHELEEANQRLRELDKMKSDFIALVSHELRTPLTLLEGYTHLLHNQADANSQQYPPDMVQLIQGLNTGVGRLSQVINEVINVARVASGSLELSLGPVRLSDLVRQVAQNMRTVAEERQVALNVEEQGELPVIQADGKQLTIALENVVGNAIKYTPNGGSITIRSQLMNNAVGIIVKDTGIGIPAYEQRRIFDQFYVLESIEHHSTSKSAFRGGGLGLGLAITRGIVEAHKGRVWVESPGYDPDTLPGSTFHILLPLEQEA